MAISWRHGVSYVHISTKRVRRQRGSRVFYRSWSHTHFHQDHYHDNSILVLQLSARCLLKSKINYTFLTNQGYRHGFWGHYAVLSEHSHMLPLFDQGNSGLTLSLQVFLKTKFEQKPWVITGLRLAMMVLQECMYILTHQYTIHSKRG